MRRLCALLILGLISLAGFVSAHEAGLPGVALDESIRHTTVLLVIVGSFGIAALIGIASLARRSSKGRKSMLPSMVSYALFLSISATVIGVTAYVAGSTIYLNVAANSGGPVHWHADFEVWNCGQKVDLISPEGFSNKVGSAVLHVHGDDRIHIEGVMLNHLDAGLGSFWGVVGGDLHGGLLAVPTNSGMVVMRDGDNCGSGRGVLQVFTWKAVDGRAVQEKLSNYVGYIISPYSQVPPGDCIIFEFDSEVKQKTERMCETYNVAIGNGDLNGG